MNTIKTYWNKTSSKSMQKTSLKLNNLKVRKVIAPRCNVYVGCLHSLETRWVLSLVRIKEKKPNGLTHLGKYKRTAFLVKQKVLKQSITTGNWQQSWYRGCPYLCCLENIWRLPLKLYLTRLQNSTTERASKQSELKKSEINFERNGSVIFRSSLFFYAQITIYMLLYSTILCEQ